MRDAKKMYELEMSAIGIIMSRHHDLHRGDGVTTTTLRVLK